MYAVLKKHGMILALCIGLMGSLICSWYAKPGIFDLQQGIAKEVLRFHVKANSDTKEDQELKQKVKEETISYLKNTMGEQKTKKETEQWIGTHLEEIRQQAEETVKKQGYSYRVRATLSQDYFPIKQYGDCTLPNGIYDALQIKIGAAKGKNWWCVLFPSLCYTDATCRLVTKEKKEELGKILTDEEYDLVTNKIEVKVKFHLFGS